MIMVGMPMVGMPMAGCGAACRATDVTPNLSLGRRLLGCSNGGNLQSNRLH